MRLVPPLAKGDVGTHHDPVVLLVDRHALILEALSKVLSDAGPQWRIHTATRSDRALEILSKEVIDLALCDVRCEPIDGPQLVDQVGRLSPQTRTILLADPEDAPLLLESLLCGAAGFFTRDASPEEFLEGVDAVLAGHYVLGRNLAQSGLKRMSAPVEKRRR
jgi:DNA-binding NarL/FixJ family response regulator